MNEIKKEQDLKDIKSNSDINNNIFKELSGELDFGDDNQENYDNKKKKDKIYYLNLISQIFYYVNIFLFIFSISFFSYVKIQNSTSFYSKSFLDPLCFIILGDLESKNTGDYCSSVASLKADYIQKTSNLKQEILKKLKVIAEDLYNIENFENSKEVTFLLINKNNKLKIVDILNDFDRLKNDFSFKDKKSINCKNMSIDESGVISVSCDFYSSSWEKVDKMGNGIIGVSGDKNDLIEGTSISIAASFLNFIERNPQYNFLILEKQKVFDSEIIVGEGPYVRKTTVDFKLKYNNFASNLSF